MNISLSLSLSLFLSLSFSPSQRAHLTHNIPSASTLDIVCLLFLRYLFMPFDIRTILCLTRALCRSLVFERSVVRSWFLVKRLYVWSFLLKEQQEARLKKLPWNAFAKDPKLTYLQSAIVNWYMKSVVSAGGASTRPSARQQVLLQNKSRCWSTWQCYRYLPTHKEAHTEAPMLFSQSSGATVPSLERTRRSNASAEVR